MTTAIEKTKTTVPKTVKSWVSSDYFRQQVALVLPKHLTPDRFVRICVTALTRTPKLTQCTPESVLSCMMACSQLGLEPDGRRAHLIPYKDQCTLIVDYKGLVELAMRSGTVSSIFAQTICDRDNFTYDTGEIHHRIDFKQERGPMYAAYCVVKFKDGGMHTEVMTKADIDRIRARSKASSQGPWATDYEEMAKKTVFRRASKWIQLSPEVQDALERDSDPVPGATSLVAEMPLALPEASGPEPTEPAPIETTAKVEPLAEPPRTMPAPAPEPIPPQAAPEGPPNVGEPEITVQQTLADVVNKGGYTFSQFQYWAEDTGNVPDAGSLAGFDDVKTNDCKRLLRATVGLLRGLQLAKEGGVK